MSDGNDTGTTLKEDLGRAFDEISVRDAEKSSEMDQSISGSKKSVEESGQGGEGASGEEAGETGVVSEDETRLGGDEEGEEEVGEGAEGETSSEDEEASSEDEEEEAFLEPLKHWHKEDREEFKKMPREAQEFVMRRDKEFQSLATKKMMEVSDIKKAMDPVRDVLQKHGVSDADAVRRLVGAHLRLQENPRDTIIELAASYGLDISAIIGHEEGEAVADSASDKQIAELKKELAAVKEMTLAERQSLVNRQIEEFKADKEFFEEVQPEMAELAWSARNQGKEVPSLGVLYEKACRLNDGVWEKIQARKKDPGASKQRLKRAQAASRTNITGTKKSTSKGGAKKPESMRETLAKAFDEVEERQRI